MEVNYGAILSVVLVLFALETQTTEILCPRTGFGMTPQNATIIAGQSLNFICSAKDFCRDGIDWTFSNASVTDYNIFECQTFNNCILVNNLDNKTYKLEQPDNVTNNLIVLHANPINTGKYCCHYPNGMRDNIACAFATVEGVQTTTISTTGQTTTGSTTGNSKSQDLPDNGVISKVVVGIIIAVIAIVIIAAFTIYFILKKRRASCRRSNVSSRPDAAVPLNEPTLPNPPS